MSTEKMNELKRVALNDIKKIMAKFSTNVLVNCGAEGAEREGNK